MHAAFSESSVNQSLQSHSPLSITSPCFTSIDEKTSNISNDLQEHYSFETSLSSTSNNNVLSLFSLAQLYPQQLIALTGQKNNDNVSSSVVNQKRKHEKPYKFEKNTITKKLNFGNLLTPNSILNHLGDKNLKE